MNPDPTCIAWGAAVSWIVDLLKFTPIRRVDPRIIAAILSVFGHFIHGLVIGGAPWGAVLWCALNTFGLSIATHELDKHVGDLVFPGPQTKR